jgi:hypothetical protein
MGPNLHFQVEQAEPMRFAAAPQLVFRLRVTQRAGAAPALIHSIALRCQLRIEPARRRYQPGEQARLRDLFGEPHRWGETLRGLLWTHAYVTVPSFTGATQAELPVPCTYDFNVAATKYFYALEDGEVPLTLLFSGTVFHAADDGRLQVAQVPWDQEADFRLPVRVWQEMMDHYYPNSAWLCLRRDVFDRLDQFKRQHGLPTWEQALEQLLPATTEAVPS